MIHGQQNVKFDNSLFETVEQFKCLGKTCTNENYIREEIKNRFKSKSACYHSVQNLLSSILLSKITDYFTQKYAFACSLVCV
jgi:hypothetical protein